MKHALALAAGLALGATAAAAEDFTPRMQAFLESNVVTWMQNPVLVEAIRAQNARHSGLAQDDIDALDQAWQAEIGTGETPTITPVLSGPAADFLRERVAASGGTITEIFAMDNRGLNVAASAVTSDYWQGDEAKFTETYPRGPGAAHFSEIEFDESTQTYQGQISVVITDPGTGDPIGALTVGVNAESLF